MENQEFERLPEEGAGGETDIILEQILAEFHSEPEAVPPAQQKQPQEPVQEPPRRGQKKPRPSWQSALLSYLHDLVYLLAALIVSFLLLFRVVVVSGTSMNNTLYDGDYLLLLNNIFYHDPQYGDIIVASKESFDGGAPIVKRVIATEGQTVDIDFAQGIVYVDGVALEEEYTMTPTNIQEGIHFPLEVEEGHIFVMGDNRNGSKDSRSPEIGLVDKREVIGKVCLLFLPGTNTLDDPREFDIGRIGLIGGIDG